MSLVSVDTPLLKRDFKLDCSLQELERYALLEDYHRFIRKSWNVMDPGVPFIDGMPIEAVTDHVQALMEGTLGTRNLLINIPPRCMKSTSVSVALVPWVWAHPEWAHLKFLYTSYAGDLSMRDSVKARRLIKSPWYQERFGGVYQLTGDQNVKGRFDNNQNGTRLATSVGGGGTGEGGDVIICDDPHNAAEAESDAVREGTVTWWRETMSTRGNNPNTVKRIIVMQRLHEADLSGYVLANELEDYTHLCLPMRYEAKVQVPGVRFVDPRSKDGQLLWPERFNEAEVAKLERNLGSYGAAGQLQQRPAPRGGGLIKEAWLQLWPARKELPPFKYILQSYDTALTDKTYSDDTAATVYGVFEYGGVNCAMVLDAWDEKMTYSPLRRRILEEWKATYGARKDDDLQPGRRSDQVIIENKGSGISILQDLQAARVPAISYNPGKADKTARVMQVLPLLELEVLYVLESRKEPGQPVTWVRKAIKQWTMFPSGAHDDYVDTLTQAIIYLRDIGMLDLPSVEMDERDDDEDDRRSKPNPYAQ